MKNISKNLINLRAKLNLSQEKTAQLFNVSFATINRWENKKSLPTKIHIIQLENLCKENNVKIE